jgi:hypothetical protein
VPGIRPKALPTTTRLVRDAREALDAGADLLVIGRAVTEASDPCAAPRPGELDRLNAGFLVFLAPGDAIAPREPAGVRAEKPPR